MVPKNMKSKYFALIFPVAALTIILLLLGESGFNHNTELVVELRLPKVLACIFAGGLLAIAGLLMQIFFQNPLAGPDILGVSSGSSLFVAMWMMAGAGLSPAVKEWGMNIMSFAGALSVFLLLLFFLQKNISRVSLIIIGLLISSFAASGISILVSMSQALQLKNFLMWGMGSFRNITQPELPKFIFFSLMSILPVWFFIKPLNQFLLSENYAKSVGIDVKKMRMIFVSLAALQISVVTLYCGPVGFIGIISPHLARMFLRKAQLQFLLPGVFLVGAFLALLTEFILVLTPELSISVNAVLGLIGAPLIVFYLYRERSLSL
jgi:iron complex transport system permease protein